jgi:hypothetical protein
MIAAGDSLFTSLQPGQPWLEGRATMRPHPFPYHRRFFLNAELLLTVNHKNAVHKET